MDEACTPLVCSTLYSHWTKVSFLIHSEEEQQQLAGFFFKKKQGASCLVFAPVPAVKECALKVTMRKDGKILVKQNNILHLPLSLSLLLATKSPPTRTSLFYHWYSLKKKGLLSQQEKKSPHGIRGLFIFFSCLALLINPVAPPHLYIEMYPSAISENVLHV